MINADRKVDKAFNTMFIPIVVNVFGAGLISNAEGYAILVYLVLTVIICFALSIIPFVFGIMALVSGTTQKVKAVTAIVLPMTFLISYLAIFVNQ